MKFFALVLITLFTISVQAKKFDCMDLLTVPMMEDTYSFTPTGDFLLRDSLPRTEVAKENWQSCCGSWGPCPSTYPGVAFPAGTDRLEWSRIRVIEAAKKLIGVPYAHYHLPEMGGIDCSNFTALAYNYALGIRFTSNVERQAEQAGRLLNSNEAPQAGDLIFLHSEDHSRISHVVIYVDENHIIDSTGAGGGFNSGVELRPFTGKYRNRYAFARRVLE